ncbi:hypothetical protein GC169_09550 [bacterium]|nr:hypothetical protein [bacterium]
MEQLYAPSRFASYAAPVLAPEPYCIVDVGAAGGLAPAMSALAPHLTGVAFDPDPDDMARQNASRRWGDVVFLCGYVGVPRDHPLRPLAERHPQVHHNPWARLAVERWIEINALTARGEPVPARGAESEEVSAPAPATLDLDFILLPEVLEARGVRHVDFLKIDVDGIDFLVLRTLEGYLDRASVMSFGIEINWFGSADPDDNTFHNVDRFLKGRGFELFDVTTRRYSMRHLPVSSWQHNYPANAHVGRIFQGDAFYARDICAPAGRAFAQRLSPRALIKHAVTFALVGLPDCAAEVLLVFRDRVEPLIDIPASLDLLAADAHARGEPGTTYEEIIQRFEASARAAAEK